MRRTLILILLPSAVVLTVLMAEAQNDGYQVVRSWVKMPQGYIMGTPQGAPPPKEREAMAAGRGARPQGSQTIQNISAFAGVAVDQQDNVYAFHRGMENLKERYPPDLRTREHPVVVFDSSGKFLRWAGDGIPGGVLGPHMLEVDPEGHLWIVERDGHRVMKLNKDMTTVALMFGEQGVPGLDEKHFDRPTDVAWSKNGDIFITDGYGNNRVLKFTKDGKFIRQWGGGPDSRGSGDGQFHLPHSISIDWQDKLYVQDRENHRVQMFDTDGKFLGQWADICNCWGIAIKKDGGRDAVMFMTDHANEQVMKVNMADGRVLARFGGGLGRDPGQFDGAHDIAIDSKGAVYVSDTYGQRVQKFIEGKLAATLGGRGNSQVAWLPAPTVPPVPSLLTVSGPDVRQD